MEDKSMDEILFGAEFALKNKSFNDGLKKIEDKYKEYFSNREDKYLNKPDHLYYHYVVINNGSQITFAFVKDSDLDESIRTECITLFNSIYKV